MGIQLFTDSTCDLSADLLEKYRIRVIPLHINFGQQSFLDNADLSTARFYEMVKEFNQLPKTAAPSPSVFLEAFSKAAEEGNQVLYIGISSSLSSTTQNALIAGNDFPPGDVEIIDSLNLSSGIGLLAIRAAECIAEGKGLKETAAEIRSLVPLVQTEFVIDTLDYLHKGGRLTGIQHLIGSMLKIHPVVRVEDGKLILAEKLRGKRQKVLEELLQRCFQDRSAIDKRRIFVTHSAGEEGAVWLKQRLIEELDPDEVLITEAGTVISSHCGPNTVGILYINKR